MTRRLGALALFGVGVDHLEQFAVDHYSAIPTIGSLFFVNFVAAALIACALAGTSRGERWLRAGGVAVAAGSLAGLWASGHGGLFGFVESGYRPAIMVSIALELATVGLLAAPAVDLRRPRRRRGS